MIMSNDLKMLFNSLRHASTHAIVDGDEVENVSFDNNGYTYNLSSKFKDEYTIPFACIMEYGAIKGNELVLTYPRGNITTITFINKSSVDLNKLYQDIVSC